jgi:hypothetical protein
METKKYLADCFASQVQNLEHDYKSLVKAIEKYPMLAEILFRMLDLKEKSSLVFYEMFQTPENEVVIHQGYNYFGSIHSFLVNVFLDDTYFEIKWMTSKLVNGKMRYRVSTKNNPKSKPVVFLTGDGEHDPKVLFEAMDIALERDERRRREIDEMFGSDDE